MLRSGRSRSSDLGVQHHRNAHFGRRSVRGAMRPGTRSGATSNRDDPDRSELPAPDPGENAETTRGLGIAYVSIIAASVQRPLLVKFHVSAPVNRAVDQPGNAAPACRHTRLRPRGRGRLLVDCPFGLIPPNWLHPLLEVGIASIYLDELGRLLSKTTAPASSVSNSARGPSRRGASLIFLMFSASSFFTSLDSGPRGRVASAPQPGAINWSHDVERGILLPSAGKRARRLYPQPTPGSSASRRHRNRRRVASRPGPEWRQPPERGACAVLRTQ
jgi:hypothetical protein